MDCSNTIIASLDVDYFFCNNSPSLGSVLLETILRFIALKRSEGDVEKIKPITCNSTSIFSHQREDEYAKFLQESGSELLIVTIASKLPLPSINKDGWVSLDAPPYPISQYLSKEVESRVYINKDVKRAVIFVRGWLTEGWTNLLCRSMFRILPWHFEKMSDDEVALFKAVDTNNSDEFTRIINNACVPYDFRTARLKKTLTGWGSVFQERELAKHKQEAENVMKKINEQQQTLAKLLDELNYRNTEIAAFEALGDNRNDDSVVKFFCSHKNLFILSSPTNESIDYGVLDTIEFFDRDEFLRIYTNPRSQIGKAPKDIRDILYAIFGEEESKGLLRVESIFRLNGLSSLVPRTQASHKHDFTHLPHPHLIGFGCLGGNGTYIAQYMAQGDWDMAIEQSIAATKNIHFGDTHVVNHLLTEMSYRKTCRCVIADNGKEMTLAEFLTYINENKATKEAIDG